MDLIVDATVVFTGIIGMGVTKEIIFSSPVNLFSPQHLFNEVNEHKPRLLELSKLSEVELDELLSRIKSKISVIPKLKFSSYLEQARSLVNDIDDEPYIALSLSMGMVPIWSNDPHFERQSLIPIFDTAKLVRHLKSVGYSFSTKE